MGQPDAYLCGIAEVGNDDSFTYFDNVEDFFAYIMRLPSGAVLYAHNLKFDYSYLFPVLAASGYAYDEMISGIDKRIRTVKIETGPKAWIELRDSSPLFAPSTIPLRRVMESWCKVHTVKDSVPFYEYRPESVSQKFFDYFREDVLGLCEALETRFALFPEQKTKITTSSECKDMAKNIINEHFDHNKNFFDNVAFPALTLKEDAEMRKYYRGGFVWINPAYREKILKDVDVFDVNSMYPSIMEQELLPYGKVRKFKGKPPSWADLYVISFIVEYAEVKEEAPAFITNGKSNAYGSTEYASYIGAEESLASRTLHLTNIEFNEFMKCYDVGKIKYLGGFAFKSRKDLFLPYVDKFRNIKETTKGAMREFAKLALNCPSGKWGQSPDVLLWKSQLDDQGVQRFVKKEEEKDKRAFYLPTSIFITAYARMRLVKQIMKVGISNSIYTDTDSLHVLNYKPGDFDLHPSHFGLWDHEKHCDFARYNRQKRYAQVIDGNFRSTVAGIPERYLKQVCNTLEDFTPGLAVPCGRMRMKPGGMMMETMMIRL